MIDALRKASGLLVQLLAGLLLSASALGGTLHKLDPEHAGHWLLANNAPDPQVRLTGAILVVFAGGLSLLAAGYVADSLRSDRPPVHRS
jgi:hypothetical protein